MKQITILLTLLLLCGTANAVPIDDDTHYIIVVLVWDNETGEPEAGVPVTFMYHPYFADEIFTLDTAEDGSVVFDVANMPRGVRNNSVIMVSCKYGIKNAPVVHSSNGVQNWGTAVTFNEPDEATVIEILAAMGFTAVAIGGGRYLLRRKKNANHNGDNMPEDANETIDTRPKLIKDFGVRALFGTIALSGYIAITSVAVFTDRTDMVSVITNWYMPLIMAIVGFYFGGSNARGMK